MPALVSPALCSYVRPSLQQTQFRLIPQTLSYKEPFHRPEGKGAKNQYNEMTCSKRRLSARDKVLLQAIRQSESELYSDPFTVGLLSWLKPNWQDFH